MASTSVSHHDAEHKSQPFSLTDFACYIIFGGKLGGSRAWSPVGGPTSANYMEKRRAQNQTMGLQLDAPGVRGV